MIIVLFVRKETEVGIMIVHRLLFMEDMEMENQFSLINEESLEVGNIIEKTNGSKQWLHSVMD